MASESRRQSVASAAVICRETDGQPQWLCRWNQNWQCYHVVGGHKKARESFLDCVRREVSEELGLTFERDFSTIDDPLECVRYTAWSNSAGEETDYVIQLFAVHLAASVLDSNALDGEDVRWLSRADIERGQCDDGKPVSSATVRFLRSIGWECPFVSPG